jgi:HK97 family phage portal protein
MSLLRRLNREAPAEATERQLPSAFGLSHYMHGIITAGASVSPLSVQSIETALKHSVVWRCSMKNAATLASFPVHTHRGRQVVSDPRIVADPAGDGSLRSSWVFAAVLSMYLRGGANLWMGDSPEAATRPQAAPLLHPDRVDWSDKKGWTVDGKQVDLWPLGPLLHIPMYTLPGSPKGLNPLQFAARSLFPGMAAQEFGANFFRDGAHPTAIISPESDPGKDGAEALKARVMESVSGTNREPIILPQSVKWTQMQVNPEDSQFIDLMKLSDEQVCRYMGTPPEEIGIAPSGASQTYANREQRKQDYLQELQFPMRQLEGGWSSLIARPQQVRLNPDGLLRTSLKERYESYKLAAEINSLTGETFLDVDEMRDLEDREPLTDGGDDA